MILPSSVANVVVAATLSSSLMSESTLELATNQIEQPPLVPILEVIKVYGRMAGHQCYGKSAPKGSSCQLMMQDMKEKFQLDEQHSLISRSEFGERLDRLNFEWPLKPYGVESSLAKTVSMNKGAETRIFMDQLESRGLYDRRNPTGPLPTSLRPQLNQLLQKEPLDPATVDRVYESFVNDGSSTQDLTFDRAKSLLQDGMDYYGFLELVGKTSISWPY